MLSFLSFLKEGGKPAPSLDETAEHFASLGDTWWDEKGPFAVLHKLNPLRLTWLKEQMCTHWQRSLADPHALKGLRVVDVGAGGGLLTEPLSRMGGEVTGLDFVPENIRCAQEHAQKQGLEIVYHTTTLEDFAVLPENQEAFDVVVALEVIEHVENPDHFIKQAARLLKPNGLLLVSTLNRTLQSYVLGIVAAEYVLGWVPRGTHRWQAFVTPGDLRWYFVRAGLEPCGFQGLSFSPHRRKWFLSARLDVNYFASARRTGVSEVL